MLKYIGLAVIILASLILPISYRLYSSKRLAELDGIIKLVSALRDEIESYMRPLSEFFAAFSNEALCAAGFVLSGNNPSEEYRRLSGGLSLGEKTKELLSDFFERLGTGGGEREIKRADELLSALSKIQSEESAELIKTRSVVGTVSSAAGLLLVILLI